nr:MAG TPA: hypothetical protein [Caudoviricetes sp.]
MHVLINISYRGYKAFIRYIFIHIIFTISL